jgi:hypothetical protein
MVSFFMLPPTRISGFVVLMVRDVPVRLDLSFHPLACDTAPSEEGTHDLLEVIFD